MRVITGPDQYLEIQSVHPKPTSYQPIHLRTSLTINPQVCCECLASTGSQQQCKSNSSLINEIESQKTTSNSSLIMSYPICPGCWATYQARQSRRWWIGHAAILFVSLASIILTIRFVQYETYANYLQPKGSLLAEFVILLILFWHKLNGIAIRHLVSPPLIVSANAFTLSFTVRFKNPDFVPIFLAAQKTTPALLTDVLSHVDCRRNSLPISPTGDRIWYYYQDGKSVGPFSIHQLREMIHDGILKNSDRVCTHFIPEWVAVDSVPGMVG